MALIVETGAGLPDAETYESVAGADAYHLAHNNLDWLASPLEEKEAALRDATVMLDGEYNWKGSIKNTLQALGWPRKNVYDHEGRRISPAEVPRRVREATAFVAGRVTAGAFVIEQAASASAGAIKRQKVSSLEIEYFEGGGSRAAAATSASSFPTVDALLEGLHEGGGRNSIMVETVRWN